MLTTLHRGKRTHNVRDLLGKRGLTEVSRDGGLKNAITSLPVIGHTNQSMGGKGGRILQPERHRTPIPKFNTNPIPTSVVPR